MMTRLESSWLFENGEAAIVASIDHSAGTYSIKPRNGDKFTFVNQRLPSSMTSPVARLIVEAAAYCEAALTVAKAPKSECEVLDVVDGTTGKLLPNEEHPDVMIHPTTGERLIKVGTVKAPGKKDQINDLLMRAAVDWAPEAAQALTERMMAPERAATLEVGIQGSTEKIVVPGVVDYGPAPTPDRVRVSNADRFPLTHDDVVANWNKTMVPDPNAPPAQDQTHTSREIGVPCQEYPVPGSEYGAADGQHEMDAAELEREP